MSTARAHPWSLALAIVALLAVAACGTAPPTPTPASSAPTTTPAASTTPAAATPTLEPSPTVSPSPTPTPSPTVPPPTDAAGILLAHIPDALRPTCMTSTTDHGLAALDCTPQAGGLAVHYTLFADTTTMNSSYTAIAAQAQIEPDTGSCFVAGASGIVSATPDGWPSENAYDVDGSPAGRYVCLVLGNQPTIAWTYQRLDIMGQASATAPDGYDGLVTFWLRDSGPTP